MSSRAAMAAWLGAGAAIVLVLGGCAAHSTAALPRVALGAAGPDSTRKTVPFFEKAFTYSGTTYPLQIVGTDPSLGTTTVLADQIVPLELVFSNGIVLDGANQVPTLVASPVFVDAPFASGMTQFSDATMRAEFWGDAVASDYHVLLAPPTIEPTVRIDVPAADGSVMNGEGQVTFQWFVKTIEPQVLQQLGVDPTSLTIFVTERTEVLEKTGFCCFGGFHSAFNLSTPAGPATFITAWSSVRPGSVVGIAHEVTEAFMDPFYTNNVPPWVKPMHSSCGGKKLEVGDPLAGRDYTIDGYQVSDMTFYSWFSRDMPSSGINGQYDMLGLLPSAAAVCP